MAVGLYSGVSGLALGVGLYKGVNGLWGGASGLINGFGGAFSPASLFALGEPGAWYDPSDFSTMYQDSVGTTPVTAAGQQVGLLLDKSQGLVLGPELGDGTINNVSNWVLFGSNTIAQDGDGVAITFVNNSAGAYQFLRETTGLNTNLTVGKWYRITGQAKVNSGSANVTVLNASTWTSSAITATSFVDFTIYFLCDNATTNYIAASNLSAGEIITIRNISVKELPGNHATQATSAQRPTLGRNPVTGTRNLLTYTEQFDNAAWAKVGSNAVANSTTAPDSTTTADTLRLNAGATVTTSAFGLFTAGVLSYWSQPTASALSAGTHTASIYVKAASGLTHVQLRVALSANLTTSPSGLCLVRLSDGAVIDSTGGLGTVQDAGNGWWRISIPFTATAAIHHVGCWFWNSTSISSAAGTEGYFVWGAQLETGSTATAYQRVVSAFDVTQAGVADAWYLSCDGTDDGMVTNTITPGIDKAQVFAGVRKLSDAATGAVLELSVNAGANNGVIDVQAPSGGAANYRFGSRGTIGSGATAAGFSAPITNVLTGIGDIAADTAILRVNGTQVASSAADQGTGNYLAYPLYIGRRGGTSLPFNGRIYSLIVRFGANLDAATILQTETWVGDKTGVNIPLWVSKTIYDSFNDTILDRAGQTIEVR